MMYRVDEHVVLLGQSDSGIGFTEHLPIYHNVNC